MVSNTVQTSSMEEGKKKNEMKELMSQLSLGINIIVMAVVAFVAGYFIFSTRWGTVAGVIAGLFCGIGMMLVEMWLFIIRGSQNDTEEAKRSKAKDHKQLPLIK